MSLLHLPPELLETIGSYCAAVKNWSADDLNNLRLSCKTMNEILESLFLSLYLQDFHVPFTPAGLDRLRFVSKSERQYHVKTLLLDAGFFISTGDKTPDDAMEDIIHHPDPDVGDEAIKWNKDAWELVRKGTLRKTLEECLLRFSKLEELIFCPPDLDEVFLEKNNRMLSERWRLLLEILLPIALQQVPHVRSIKIEDAFCRPYCWMSGTPEYRWDSIPVGAPLSIISLLFGSRLSFEALSTLKLSISICESELNEDYAIILRHGLRPLTSLKSLHLSFESHDSSAPAFFNDFVQGLDQMPLKHFGLTLLTPLPGCLPKLLSKCEDIESITLLLVGLSLQEWNNGLEQHLFRKTLVNLNLRYINVDNQGADFSKYNGGKESLGPELILANIRNMAKKFTEVQASSDWSSEAWTIGHVLVEDY